MKRIALIALGGMLIAGCDKEVALHSQLEERQANLVMAALLDEGISCHKTSGDEGLWNVMILEADFAAAANLLERRGFRVVRIREWRRCSGRQAWCRLRLKSASVSWTRLRRICRARYPGLTV